MKIVTRYEVSIFAYNFAKKSLEDCCRFRNLCDKAPKMEDKIGHQLNEMQNSMMCFLFCVTCLEAYINTYGGDKILNLLEKKRGDTSKLLWEKLERLRLEDKWFTVPKLLLEKTFELKEEPYKSLKWLVDKRNFIVHYKAKFREPKVDRLGNTGADIVFTEYTLETAEKAFQLVKNIIKTLHNFDNSKAPDWVK